MRLKKGGLGDACIKRLAFNGGDMPIGKLNPFDRGKNNERIFQDDKETTILHGKQFACQPQN